MKKKANLLYRWRSCGKVVQQSHVYEKSLLHRLTGSVIFVGGLRVDANCPIRTVSCVANFYKLSSVHEFVVR